MKINHIQGEGEFNALHPALRDHLEHMFDAFVKKGHHHQNYDHQSYDHPQGGELYVYPRSHSPLQIAWGYNRMGDGFSANRGVVEIVL